MTFLHAAQKVGCTDIDRRILLFQRWIRGREFNIFACCMCFCFDNYILIILLTAPIDLKKVHLRNKNRGNLIARRVIREAMIPSFT